MLVVFEEDVIENVNYSDNPELRDDPEHQDNYIVAFGLPTDMPYTITIDSVYFAFTSLSTVGFGDRYPTNDLERIVGAFLLLFGVAIFSIVMQTMSDIIQILISLNAEFDDDDNLAKFLCSLYYWNEGRAYKCELR